MGVWLLAAVGLLLAALCGVWIRAVLRRRGDEIPCTVNRVPILVVLIAVIAMILVMGGSGLVIARFRLFGAGPLAYTAYLLSMSAVAILLVFALVYEHTNRTAIAWIRFAAPNTLTVRGAAGTDTLTLAPGDVTAFAAEGAAGVPYLNYVIVAGGRTLSLVCPASIRVLKVVGDLPWRSHQAGLLVQGRTTELHRFLEPFRMPS